MEKPQPPPPVAHAVGARPVNVYCPHCRTELQLQAQHAGAVVSCPSCGGRFQSPLPQATASAGYHGELELHPGIKICVLISGIGNILAGVFWIATLCGVVIGVPQIVLGVFELIFFAQADRKPLRDALSHAHVLGILEIVSGFFNLVSLVCGILVLVFASNQKT